MSQKHEVGLRALFTGREQPDLLKGIKGYQMKKVFSTIALAALVTGCAAPSVTPPHPTADSPARDYNAEFSEVWEHSVDWFATNNIPIKNIEKDSGIISSDYSLGSNFTQLDCGTVDPGGMHALIDSDVTANINVLVRDRNNGVTVQPNVFGQGRFVFRNAWDYSILQTLRAERCVSTGELERSLHNYIENHL